MKKIVVAGGGVLGSQIAFQAAYCGFDVTIWLRSQSSIGRTQPKLDNLKKTYEAAIESMATGTGPWCAGIADFGALLDKDACLARVQAAYEGLKLELDMAAAVADADLVIESMAEDPKAKIEFYQKLAPVLPSTTVVVTNSSTLLPSTFAARKNAALLQSPSTVSVPGEWNGVPPVTTKSAVFFPNTSIARRVMVM